MTRAVRTVTGLGLIAVSALAICWAIYGLVRIGTCASGGPYVIAQPCPPGTGGKILGLVGGIFGILIGAAVSPLKGSPAVAWGLGFTLIGLGALVAAVGPAHPAGGDGLAIFGWAFGGFMILLGVLGLVGGLLLGRGVEVAQAKVVEMSGPGGVSFSSTPMVSVEGSALTPEQATRVGDSLRAVGMADLAGFVENAVEGHVSPAPRAPSPTTPAEDLTDAAGTARSAPFLRRADRCRVPACEGKAARHLKALVVR